MRIPDIPTEIIYVTREDEVGGCIEEIVRYPIFGFDTETTGLFVQEGAKPSLAQFGLPTGRVYVFDMFTISPAFLRRIFPARGLCVGQNLKFDFGMLQYWYRMYDFGNTFDTMLAGQIVEQGRVAGDDYVPVGLEALCDRWLGVDLPKEYQLYPWAKRPIEDKALEYAARDALVVLPLYQTLVSEIKEQKQLRVSEIEFNAVPAVSQLEINGMRLHSERWLTQCEANKKDFEQSRELLWDKLSNKSTLFSGIQTIKLGSPEKVADALRSKGVKLPISPKTGKECTDSKLLGPLADKHIEVQALIDYRKMEKRLQSYGPNWIDKISPVTGHIHPSWKQIGAETGRMACTGPNLTQIPKSDAYRNCFIADDGWVLIDSDYSQMELRILAEFCKDPNLLRAFDKGYDLHRYSAHLIYKVPLEEVTGTQRGIAKNLNFGIVYGIGANKFGADSGLHPDEAKRIMNFYLNDAYPQMGQWLKRQAANTVKYMTAWTALGRRRRYFADKTDSEAMAKIERNGKNHPVQGGNADIIKRAIRLLYDKIKDHKYIKLIHVVHDEIILTATPEYVNEAVYEQRSAMLKAEEEFLIRCPSKVDTTITLEWSKEPTEQQLLSAQKLLSEYGISLIQTN